MTKKAKISLSFPEKLRLIKNAGLRVNPDAHRIESEEDDLEDIGKRIKRVLNIYQSSNHNPLSMIYFIMYDIEDHKIRRHIAKYLIQKGCVRVQKSIFMAQSQRAVFQEIHQTLKEVQELFDNNDSILFVPVSVDLLRSMKILGQSIDVDLIIGNRNTLFF